MKVEAPYDASCLVDQVHEWLPLDQLFEQRFGQCGIPSDDDVRAQVTEFIRCLYAQEDILEIRLIREEGDVGSFWHDADVFTVCAETYVSSNVQGYNVYFGVNPRTHIGGTTNEDVALCRNLCADFDHMELDEVRQRLAKSRLPAPTVIVMSGHGVHAYWRLVDPLHDPGLWTRHQKALIKLLDSDPAVHDPARVMRMPGFLNTKRAPFQRTMIVEHDANRRYMLDQFPDPVEPEPVREDLGDGTVRPLMVDTEGSSNPELLERCINYLSKMPDAIDGQGGSNATFSAACRCFRFGLSEHDAWQAMQFFNAHRCQPAWTEKELQHKLEDAKKTVTEAGQFGDMSAPHQMQPEHGVDSDERIYVERADPVPLATAYLQHCWHDELGQLFLRRWKGDFYEYDSTHYQVLPKDEMKASIYRFLERCWTDQRNRDGSVVMDEHGQPRLRRIKARKSLVDEVIEALPASHDGLLLPSATDMPSWIGDVGPDVDPMESVICTNGILHVPTGTLHPLTPDLFSTCAVEYAYDPDVGKPTEWLAFLKQLFGEDQQAIDLLQEWFGYCLVPDTSQQKIMLIVGPKRSGKGTIARVLTAMLGSHNVCSPTLNSFTQNFGMSTLIGKLLATITDARLSGRADQVVILERLLSISGEDSLTIDRKHRDPMTIKLPTRIMIMTNEEPAFRDASGAIASRFIGLQLMTSFYGKEDTQLTKRLLEELPGILNWAIAGYQRLIGQGRFTDPDTSQQLKENLEGITSPIQGFIRECCLVDPNYSIPVDDLYEAWKKYCEREGRHPGAKETFGKNLRAALPRVERGQPRNRGRRQSVYQGICLDLQAEGTAVHRLSDRRQEDV
jgi:putative DNA primase/helicase